MNAIYTIGYSTYDMNLFIKTLKENCINAVADVRSLPYSKYKPEYDKDSLEKSLISAGIYYVFLGEELGARSKCENCYKGGRADHALIAKSEPFKKGISRILTGLEKFTIVLMCAESDPINCHRNILICRHLKKENIHIFHILENGKVEDNCKTEKRLSGRFLPGETDMFMSPEEALNFAYDKRSTEIAYKRENKDNDF